MKNRILKRPMFKMGGSTDGIMSGLDTPSLDASRATYDRGDISDLEKEQREALKTIEESSDLAEGASMRKEAETDLKKISPQLKSKRNQLSSLKKDPLTGFYGSEMEIRIVDAVSKDPKFAGKEGTVEFEKEVRKRAEAALGRADGGRIGYQDGSMVEAPTRTEVQNLDFTTLRSRLPREIGDDIVKLISDSGEALTDFANIRTQQDVDDFNQTYKVNLVLPAEV
jgi:hypothetical protein